MVIPFGPLNESNREVGPIVIWGTTITRMLPLINMAVSLRVRHDNPQLTISEIDIQVQQSKSSKQGAHEMVSISINVAMTLAWYQHTNNNI